MRLFIAIPLVEQAKFQLNELIHKLKPLSQSVRWVKPENLHLTLRFLGETSENQIDNLKNAIEYTTKAFNSFSTKIANGGGFPNRNHPKVIWVGMNNEKEKLVSIAELLKAELIRFNFDLDNKQFKPHLTIGRIKQFKKNNEAKPLFDLIDKVNIEFPVERITLVQSTLTPQGPIYKELYSSVFSNTNIFEG